MDESNWQFLVHKMTPYYRNLIESQWRSFKNYKSQLVEKTMDTLVFKVWRVTYESDSEPDDATVYDSESDRNSDDAHSDSDADTSSAGPRVVVVASGDGGTGDTGSRDDPITTPQPKRRGFAEMRPFLYRKVRQVRLQLDTEKKRYYVMCSCAEVEGCCCICRRILTVMHLFEDVVSMAALDWHPRVLLAQYHKALLGKGNIEECVALMRDRVHPFLRQVVVEEWLARLTCAPTTQGVPDEGELDEIFCAKVARQPGVEEDYDAGGHEEGEGKFKVTTAPAAVGSHASIWRFLMQSTLQLKLHLGNQIRCGKSTVWRKVHSCPKYRVFILRHLAEGNGIESRALRILH